MKNLSRIDRLASAAQTLRAAKTGTGLGTVLRTKEPAAIELQAEWDLTTFAGRFSEISGASAGACLTLVFRMVLEVQKQGEPVAWITHRKSMFFPPDAAESGIDISAVAVIRGADNLAVARAGEHLLRSGAFGLVVLDIGVDARLPQHAQSRLTGQARRHHTALICITEKESHQPSMGSLVSLRAHTERLPQTGQQFSCRAKVLKDKSRGPGWDYVEICHGPDGLY